MACGSRPVERIPEPGAFPTVGINPAAGLLRTAASVLNPPLPTAGWQIAPADQGGTGSSQIQDKSNPIPAFPLKEGEGARQKHRELRLLLHLPHMTPVIIECSAKLQAVCRAAGWGDWSRCAVRMTAKGSVTPWMACGSRPVKGSPERGAFPTVGIHQWPGVKGAGPFAPLPPPPTAGWQIATADGAEPDQANPKPPIDDRSPRRRGPRHLSGRMSGLAPTERQTGCHSAPHFNHSSSPATAHPVATWPLRRAD